MSSTIERLSGRPALPDLPGPSDWAEAGFPVLDAIPATHGVHVEERLADGRYVLQAELPGIDAEDIEIIVAGGRLTIRAVRGGERQGRAEFSYGHFTPLPPGAMSDEATAGYKHGVLTITMPVLEPKPGKRTTPVREPLSVGAH
ncbi:Hsp20/alpha crystallin family protein [Streptomyces sp. TRM S81-3]|uniref:Hsp20/alpha crystallin family protein n=1 Tax=Streptomyces griseicoloratus TaxID=2752516 RepID=A0A926L4Y8_9ACTN|nr:Hsp20/alpha crystallin family protein [Streptomyces griseicoloratus]MBD0422685.1 Hsp20/alpha crystallin family protein [Streptomyces griseicoloratus]